MNFAVALPCPIYQVAQPFSLAPRGIEILRRQPALEGAFARRPVAIEHGVPGGVAAASLHDHVLAKNASEGEAEAQRGPPRGGIEGVAFPFVAPVAQRFERMAG